MIAAFPARILSSNEIPGQLHNAGNATTLAGSRQLLGTPCLASGLELYSAGPGANGVVELSSFEFLDRRADFVPPPRKHRHRYHGVCAPNHKLRRAVTALAIGNIGTREKARMASPA